MPGSISQLPKQKQSSGYQRDNLFLYPGLLDVSLVKSLCWSFLFAFVSLLAIFLVFTLFELWRFIAANGTSAQLVGRYMLFLLPLVAIQMIPASVLIAMLASYALMSKRSETVAWWACGQSIYRLMLPGLLFAAGVGAGTWFVQERVMPQANIRQDALRSQIRGGPARVTTKVGRQWLASAETGRLYAYEYDEETSSLKDPTIYEFDQEGVHLRRVLSGQTAQWIAASSAKMRNVDRLEFQNTYLKHEFDSTYELNGIDPPQLFKPSVDKPAQLSAKSLSAYIKTVKARGGHATPLAVALQRKYAEPLVPIVMTLIAIPLAVTFGRRGSGGVATLGLAVGVGLSFWLLSGSFQYLGAYGLLPIAVASWAPLIIYACAGIYQLARIRT